MQKESLKHHVKVCGQVVRKRQEGTGGSGRITPLIRNPSTRWWKVASFTPWSLYHRQYLTYIARICVLLFPSNMLTGANSSFLFIFSEFRIQLYDESALNYLKKVLTSWYSRINTLLPQTPAIPVYLGTGAQYLQ